MVIYNKNPKTHNNNSMTIESLRDCLRESIRVGHIEHKASIKAGDYWLKSNMIMVKHRYDQSVIRSMLAYLRLVEKTKLIKK